MTIVTAGASSLATPSHASNAETESTSSTRTTTTTATKATMRQTLTHSRFPLGDGHGCGHGRIVAAATLVIAVLLATLSSGGTAATASILPLAVSARSPTPAAAAAAVAAASASASASAVAAASASALASSSRDVCSTLPRGGAAVDAAAGTLSSASASTAGVGTDVRSILSRLGGPVGTALLSLRTAASSSVKSLLPSSSSERAARQAKFLLAGAVAGIVSRTVVSPLEVIATAQMVRGRTSGAAAASAGAGLLSELSHLYKTEGYRGFFKGNGANCLKVAPTRGVQFLAFESFKSALVRWKQERVRGSHRADIGIDNNDIVLAPWERLVAGGVAGMIASSMVYPLEVIKTMLTVYPGKYDGIGSAFRAVLAQAGPTGLYKGLAPTLVAMFPYVGVEFMFYETTKIAVETVLAKKREAAMAATNTHGRSTNDDNNVDAALVTTIPTIVSLGLGALAGAMAQTSAHPFDVVRKRLQVQGLNGNPILYKTTLDAFMGVAKKEGIGALYRGLGPACVATIPGTGVAYIVYESMKKVLGLTSV